MKKFLPGGAWGVFMYFLRYVSHFGSQPPLPQFQLHYFPPAYGVNVNPLQDLKGLFMIGPACFFHFPTVFLSHLSDFVLPEGLARDGFSA